MRDWSVSRWTGAFGLAGVILQLVAFALIFGAGVSPPISQPNKLVTYVSNAHFLFASWELLFLIGVALLLGFFAGFRALVVAASPHHEWLGTAVLASGVAFVVVAFVDIGVWLTMTAEVAGSKPDPGSVRTLLEAAGVLAGAPALVPIAFFLGAAGSAAALTRVVPYWLAPVGWVGSVLLLIASLSAYGGNEPTGLWSADGIVAVLVAPIPFYVWMLGASVGLLRRGGRVRSP